MRAKSSSLPRLGVYSLRFSGSSSEVSEYCVITGRKVAGRIDLAPRELPPGLAGLGRGI